MPPRFDPLLDLEAGFPWRKELANLISPALVVVGFALLIAGAMHWLQTTSQDVPPLSGVLIPDPGIVLALWGGGIALLCLAAVRHRHP